MAAKIHEQTETRGQAGVQRLKADTRRSSPAQPVLLASQERKCTRYIVQPSNHAQKPDTCTEL